MRYLTTLLSCLLSLFGCQERATSTSITRISEHGMDQLFSRTTVRDGTAAFECVRSASGRCHYLVFSEQCDSAQHCSRQTLQQFALGTGQVRRWPDLPAGFSSCVGTTAQQHCQR